VLSENQVSVLVCDQLTAEVADIEASPELVDLVRQRLGRRHRRNSAILGVVAALVVVGIAVPMSVGRDTVGSNPARSATQHRVVQVDGPPFSLAGYSAHLPSGYRVDAAGNTTCRRFWISTGPMPRSGQALPSQQGSALVAFQGAGIAGCLTVANSANYSTGPKGPGATGDPVVPKGAKALTIGKYHAFIYKTPSILALYVEIPTTGGGYHDLVVGAQGMSAADLVSLVQKALPTKFEPSAVEKIPTGSSTTAP
jgi:hypothetical protein